MTYYKLPHVLSKMKEAGCTVSSRTEFVRREKSGDIVCQRANRNKRNKMIGDRVFSESDMQAIVEAFSPVGSQQWRHTTSSVKKAGYSGLESVI